MELFELRYAITVMECLNFSRAAEKLFITQPSLSQQIQRLEKKLGFSLFNRNSKQVALTPEGKRFFQYAVKVVNDYDNLEKEVRRIKQELDHKITFGASSFIGPIISEGLVQFLSEHPDLNLKFLETSDPELINMVSEDKIDLAVVALPENPEYAERFRRFPIQEEHVCVVLAQDHPLARRPSVTLEELLPYKMIFSSTRTGLKNVVFSAFDQHDLTPLDPFEITSAEIRLPFLMDGAVAFSLSAQNSWKTHRNIIRIPVYPRIYSTITLITSKDKHISPELDVLIQIMFQKIKTYFDLLSEEKK